MASDPPAGKVQPQPAIIPAESVRAQLRRIQASPPFARSENLRKFLQFIVEQTLDGHEDHLKEYQVGIASLGRSKSYDPRIDPAVRVEARRLRSALDVYYANEGIADAVVIRLPKGGYVPVFAARPGPPGVVSTPEPLPVPAPETPGPAGAWQNSSALEVQIEPPLPAPDLTVAMSTGPASGPAVQVGSESLESEALRTGQTAEPASSGTESKNWLTAWKLLAIVAGIATLSALGLVLKARTRPQLTDKDTVVLADFANSTGDPIFDGALRQGISSQLTQSPFLNLLSDSRVAQTLTLMAQPRDTRLTGELARQVCDRTASKATIEGSISRLGSQYVLGLKVLDCHTGNLLAEEQETADSKELVLKALGRAATQLRAKLGESLASVHKYDAPPENVTTASLEALKAYSVGFKLLINIEDLAAVALFREAVTLDPNFAMAYSRQATCYYNLGEFAKASESVRRAYRLQDRVSEWERLFILAQYHEMVTGNLEEGRRTYEIMAQLYPRNDVAAGDLGNIYLTLGEYGKAIAASQQALRSNPDSRIWYVNLVDAYLGADQPDKAEATAKEAIARNLESSWIHISLYQLAFLRRNAAGLEKQAAAVKGTPGDEGAILQYQSEAAAYVGQFARARSLSRRAAVSAQRGQEKENAANYLARAAVREALVANLAMARQLAQEALLVSRGRDPEAMAAFALALADDSPQATRLTDDLATRFPEDTLAWTVYMPMVRAAIYLKTPDSAKHADKGVGALASTAAYETGRQASAYPIYLRGMAYLTARRGPEAAGEFQRIVDHPGVITVNPIGALAHLGLARAFALSGDYDRSRNAYRDFLGLWSNADADLAILRQAKAEYAKLP